jgi:hypothetical protein
MSVRVNIKMVPRYAEILKRERTVRRLERERAEQAADIARSNAPVGKGDYRDSIGVEQEGDTVQLVARDFKAHWIEWGTIHNRAFGTLTNAAQEVADRIRLE